MSSKPPKIRVVVRKGGRDREIISVLDRPNGDLLISLKGAYNSTHGSEVRRLKQQRYSVHRSEQAGGFTIKMTHEMEGRLDETAQFRTLNSDGHLLTWIYAHVMPDLSDDRYIAAPRAGDRLVHPYGYQDAGMGTFAYFVGVTTDRQTPFEPLLAMRTSCVDFREFRLLFASGFFLAPPLTTGSLRHLATSSAKINGVSDGWQMPIENLSSLEIPDFKSQLYSILLPGLQQMSIVRIKEYWKSENKELGEDLLAFAAQLHDVFLPLPIYKPVYA